MSLTHELENVNSFWNVRDQGTHIIVSGNERKAEITAGRNYEIKIYDETGSETAVKTVPTKDQLIDVLEEDIH